MSGSVEGKYLFLAGIWTLKRCFIFFKCFDHTCMATGRNELIPEWGKEKWESSDRVVRLRNNLPGRFIFVLRWRHGDLLCFVCFFSMNVLISVILGTLWEAWLGL